MGLKGSQRGRGETRKPRGAKGSQGSLEQAKNLPCATHNPGAVPREQPRSPGAGAAQGGSEGGGGWGDLIIFGILGKGGEGVRNLEKNLGYMPGRLAVWPKNGNHQKTMVKNKKNKGRKTYKSITFLLIIAGSLVFLVPEGFAGNPY